MVPVLLGLSLQILLGSALQRISEIAGPFRIVPDHFEKCPEEMRPQKVNYHHYYTGWRDRKNPDVWWYCWNGTSYFVTDDDMTVDVVLASWSSRGGWKDNAYRFVMPRVCTAFRTIAPQLRKKVIMAVFNNASADCPFPPGTYSFTNMSTNFDVKVPPSFFYGKYRATGRVFRTSTGELIGCARAYGSAVPKLNHQRRPPPQQPASNPPARFEGTDED